MTIVETDSGNEYDLWHAAISGSTITADTAAEMNVNTSDGTGDGGDAASLALTGGLLRPSELASGHINHALVITVPCTNANGATVGYSWPASGGWGETCGDYWTETAGSAPTIGSLFKLTMTDAQIAASGAPAWQQTIMTALAHYGAYAEDTNGSWNNNTMGIVMQDPTSFTTIGQPNQWTKVISQYGGRNGALTSHVAIPVNRLQVIDPCVVRGTCPNASTNNPQATTTRLHAPAAKASTTRHTTTGTAHITRATTRHGTRQPTVAHAASVKHKRHRRSARRTRHAASRRWTS
jgi:hypothetical protein